MVGRRNGSRVRRCRSDRARSRAGSNRVGAGGCSRPRLHGGEAYEGELPGQGSIDLRLWTAGDAGGGLKLTVGPDDSQIDFVGSLVVAGSELEREVVYGDRLRTAQNVEEAFSVSSTPQASSRWMASRPAM